MASHNPRSPTAPPARVDAPVERRQLAIDRSEFSDRARLACPRGHIDWDRTNAHAWCRGCRRLVEAGFEDVDPEYYELYDKRNEVLVPYECVELDP